MLTLVEITNRDEWNTQLSQMPHAHILQTWEWGLFKYESTGWIPHRWVFKRGNKIVAMCSMGERKVGTLSVMYAPKGPAMNYEDSQLVADVLDILQMKAKQHRAIWLKIDPDVAYATGVPGEDDDTACEVGQHLRGLLKQKQFRFSNEQIQFHNTVTIDLTQPEEDIFMGMSGNTRRKIRTAEKKGVSIREAQINDVDMLYQLYSMTGTRNEFLVRAQAYYTKLWRTFMENDLAHALIAEYEGKPIAHVILFHFGKTCWYFYGASSNQERKRMPNYALQWAAMKWAKLQGYEIYDMWGAPAEFVEDDPMWGVFVFKRGFRGMVERRLGAWDYTPYPLLYQLYAELWPRLRAWLRKRR